VPVACADELMMTLSWKPRVCRLGRAAGCRGGLTQGNMDGDLEIVERPCLVKICKFNCWNSCSTLYHILFVCGKYYPAMALTSLKRFVSQIKGHPNCVISYFFT
jgi:hypothetical protein